METPIVLRIVAEVAASPSFYRVYGRPPNGIVLERFGVRVAFNHKTGALAFSHDGVSVEVTAPEFQDQPAYHEIKRTLRLLMLNSRILSEAERALGIKQTA